MIHKFKPWSNYSIQAKCPAEWAHIINSTVFSCFASSIFIENHGVIFLDKEYKLIEIDLDSKGTETRCVPKIHEIVQKAMELKASYIVEFHNHPNKNPNFSKPDKRFFKLLQMKCSEFSSEEDVITVDTIMKNGGIQLSDDIISKNKLNPIVCLDSIVLTYDRTTWAPVFANSLAQLKEGKFSTNPACNELFKVLKKRDYKFKCIKSEKPKIKGLFREEHSIFFKPKQKYFPSLAGRDIKEICKDEAIRSKKSYSMV